MVHVIGTSLVCHDVSVSSNEMHGLECRKSVEQSSFVGGCEMEGRRMHRNDQRGGRADVGEVLGEPVKLFLGDLHGIFAPVATCSCIGAEDVVEYDVVNLPYVERVVIRREQADVRQDGFEIARLVHVMVVIADGLIDCQAFDSIDICEILAELIRIAVPVIVPSHVAKGDAVKGLACMGPYIFIDIAAEVGEPLPVLVPAAGEMHVAEHEHGVV